MDAENRQHPTDAVSSTMAVANSNTGRVKIAVGSMAVVLLGMALFAYSTQPEPPPEPLSPTEQIMVGTWGFALSPNSVMPIMRFHADRTCEYISTQRMPLTRWRIVDSSLVEQHTIKKLSHMIGPVSMPIPVPYAVEDFEVPSSMALKKNYIRSVAFSEDGRTMTLGPLGVQSGYDLIRCKDENSNSELHTNE
ncbi:MAG: hypothetical protein WCJ09_08285 [Planctomycetota bacterium]